MKLMKIRDWLWDHSVLPIAIALEVRYARKEQIAAMFMQAKEEEHYGVEVGPFLILWPKKSGNG